MDPKPRSRFPLRTIATVAIAIAGYQSIAPTPLWGFLVGEPSFAAAANGVAASSTIARTPMSEPAILALFGAGLMLVAARLRRRKEA